MSAFTPTTNQEERMMKFNLRSLLTASLCLFVLGGTVQAQDLIEGQWINLFDGESLYGWTAAGDGNWDVTDGAITLTEGTSGQLATLAQFADFDLSVTMRVMGQGTAGIAFRSPLSGYPQEQGGSTVYLDAGEDNVAFSTISIRALGNEVTASVNGHDVEVAAPNARGHIALQFHCYDRFKKGPRLEIKEVKLRPLGMSSLFNGENLDGWNIIPERKSVFSVIDGALNIKDGNGQIETAGLFRDFVLQLDIFSNGDHLNSGVFFRTPPEVFWVGYEAQVRNEWRRDDRTQPVDYGTGGLYGLKPARKVVSTDREWFTMTVACCGNHFAVWVDGYQTAEFTDTRPLDGNSNGKNGYVSAAGTINLQGHDPTTDLSFKNIHIQSFDK
jgi:hypothetical protein